MNLVVTMNTVVKVQNEILIRTCLWWMLTPMQTHFYSKIFYWNRRQFRIGTTYHQWLNTETRPESDLLVENNMNNEMMHSPPAIMDQWWSQYKHNCSVSRPFFICWITLHKLKIFRSGIGKILAWWNVKIITFHCFLMLGNICK